MACTTILVGKNASYDGSTMIARNDDSGSGHFTAKKFTVFQPQDYPAVYKSVISGVEIPLPGSGLRITAVPNAVEGKGLWAASGVNAANVGMTATETITSNPRVLGADPLVKGGIGEEDIVYLVLPYVRSAREGVRRLGSLLEQYGTYEMNGIAFSDEDEIWWLETIGGHHWIAKRVPDDAYVTMPNQLGIDYFDLLDAEGEQVEHMASPDLRQWMAENHLNLTNTSRLEPEDILDEEFFDDDLDDMDEEEADAYEEYMADLMDLIADVREGMLSGEIFNPREAFGSHSDSDHVYNTPRAWYMQRCLNPHDGWDGEDAAFDPEDDDIPWSRVPERKVTIEDVKYVLSAHYQGTAYDCYGSRGTAASRNAYRPIGINRNSQLAVLQIRPYVPEPLRCIQWMAFGSNVFNALVGLYANVDAFPEYLSNTTDRVTTENFYWANRVIAALADARFHETGAKVESYQEKIGALGHKMLRETDRAVAGLAEADIPAALAKANDDLCAELKDQTEKLLASVLYTTSCAMRNGFAMSDNER